MKPGQTNFLFTQAQYQETVKINFKPTWSHRLNKVVELNTLQVGLIAGVTIFGKELLTYGYHCLLYYTH